MNSFINNDVAVSIIIYTYPVIGPGLPIILLIEYPPLSIFCFLCQFLIDT